MPLYPLVTALLTTGASVGGTLSKDHSRKKRDKLYVNYYICLDEPIFVLQELLKYITFLF